MKEREGDQSLPVKNNFPCIQDLVVADIEDRKQVWIKRYGTALQPHNGRNALRDLYEELLDACMYIRQEIWERENPLKIQKSEIDDSEMVACPRPGFTKDRHWKGWKCGHDHSYLKDDLS